MYSTIIDVFRDVSNNPNLKLEKNSFKGFTNLQVL